MAETNPSVKKYRDYAQEAIDEQAILDKYNAATVQQYNVQREQARQQENQFYNQMYNTQKTAMDTIRKSNAAAVSSGASRGVQAAQELSALLGLQEESVASATELAQTNRQIAQEESAAVLENVLKAYQQAAQERSQLVSQGIEAAAVDVERENVQATRDANTAAQERANTDALQSALKEGTQAYFLELEKQGKDYSKEYSTEGEQSLLTSGNRLEQELVNAKKSAREDMVSSYLDNIQTRYGITQDDLAKAAVAAYFQLPLDSPDIAMMDEQIFRFNDRDKKDIYAFVQDAAKKGTYGDIVSKAYQLKQNRK